MGLHKGQTNNPNGRKKGVPNRSTYEIRLAFQNLLDCNMEVIKNDLSKLSSKDRIYVLLRLADLVIPKVQSTPPDESEREYLQNKMLEDFMEKRKANENN